MWTLFKSLNSPSSLIFIYLCTVNTNNKYSFISWPSPGAPHIDHLVDHNRALLSPLLLFWSQYTYWIYSDFLYLVCQSYFMSPVCPRDFPPVLLHYLSSSEDSHEFSSLYLIYICFFWTSALISFVIQGSLLLPVKHQKLLQKLWASHWSTSGLFLIKALNIK